MEVPEWAAFQAVVFCYSDSASKCRVGEWTAKMHGAGLNALSLRSSVYRLIFCVALLASLFERDAQAQDNYEIQVYGSDTVAPKTTMLELHSNFTVDGSKPLPGSRYASDDSTPPITRSTKRSKLRKASTIGLKLASTSSPALVMEMDGNGSATISVLAFAFPTAGTGQWV
jgi:hypothetical protein